MKFTLLLCTLIGCWLPPSWISLSKQRMYSIYRILLIAILFTFTIPQFMNVILNINKFDEISDCIYMMITIFVADYKIIAVWINHKNITEIITIFAKKPFATVESSEEIIQQKYNKAIKKYALWYLILVDTTVVLMIIGSAFTDGVERKLPYRVWLPYDYSQPTIFYPTFIHQLIGMAIAANINIACDSLIFGLLQQICCQIEILQYRLTKISHDGHMLSNCVRHHDRIYKYAQTVNMNFKKIIAFQFMASMLVVCANLYKLVMATILTDFITLMLYTVCMLAQIFLYCWFGNELKLKSKLLSNSIYNITWYTLDENKKKSLLLIMKRSMIPIEFNSVVIITLNLDSFVSLLKASYSIFNVLKRTVEM